MADPADQASLFLQALQGSQPLDQRTCIVLAHPDDESIALGAQLARFTEAWLVVVTDGAPRNGADAQRAGFSGPEDYAAARAKELREILRLTGFDEGRLISLELADQDAAFRLTELTLRLRQLFVSFAADIVVTHAYEGGHPDHDATAFAVHQACRPFAERERPAIVEVPLYHLGSEGRVCQRFASLHSVPEVSVVLSPEQRRLKQELFAAHASQRETLGWFSVEAEKFRVAPAYDFGELPNGGRCLYDGFGWEFTSARWQELARDALRRLAGEKAA